MRGKETCVEVEHVERVWWQWTGRRAVVVNPRVQQQRQIVVLSLPVSVYALRRDAGSEVSGHRFWAAKETVTAHTED